jgi:hypothetical protein
MTVVRGWVQHGWGFLVGPQGYLVIFGFITLYVGLYSLVEARHERRANRALFERSTFMTMVASGNRATFVAAMKIFGPVQTMAIPGDPELLAPWTWFEQEWPNYEPLYMWAYSFFPHCTVEMCGRQERERTWRIDLHQATLSGANLNDVNLRGATLYNAWLLRANLNNASLDGANLGNAQVHDADLSDATLRGADFFGAVLKNTDLRGADLTGATLRRTNLSGADLRTTKGLTQEQLNVACVDDSTRLPDGLTRPAPCPWPRARP